MSKNNRMAKLPNGYHTYQGRVHNVYMNSKIPYTISNRVPMNTVSAGHLEMLPAYHSVKEERESVCRNIINSIENKQLKKRVLKK